MGQALKNHLDIELDNFLFENKELLEQYSNLDSVKGKDEKYYFKYIINNVDDLIKELSTLNLTKDMILFNINKYGYQAETEYILNSLGFEYKSKNKIKVTKAIRKQAELFELLFNVNRECYIRLRNKSTNKYRAYAIETLKDPYKLQAILKSHCFSNNKIDMMYSINCFNNMYRATEDSLFSLQNIAIDIDFDTKKYTLKKALELIKNMMGDNIPVATIIETGHRIRLLYSLKDVPVTQKSLKVYNLVAESIANNLKEFGATPQAPTTYGRIEGSINSKNNGIINNKIFNPKVYTLRELQNELLPKWERAVKKLNRNGKVVKIRNVYTLNMARLRDFKKIQSIREEGYREILCYLYRNYCLLSNMTYDEALKETLKFNSNFKVPLKENELDSDTKALNRKQYTHKSVTILNLLEITHEEEEQLYLENILSRKEYNRRDRIYQKNTYVGEKAECKREKAKKDYKDKLKENGQMSKKEQLAIERQKIKSLMQEGFSQKDIATKLNIPLRTIQRRAKEIRTLLN
ncbi:hypothetical protein FGL68_07120 [Acinetobacter baumannii]|nr:hypothetical protein [Acinetobacter baumannii]